MKAADLDSPPLITEPLVRAGSWLLGSGIQEPNGGVARFYRADLGRNLAISTEITGYTTSALAYLYSATGDLNYLDRAVRTASFLAKEAWDEGLGNFPFEYGPGAEAKLYFFDCGIIVRGLLTVWKLTGDEALLDRAVACGRAMIRDFDTEAEIHPILMLPEKQPLARDWRWSRNPGCYQLKSALAWRQLAAITGDRVFADAFNRLLQRSLKDYRGFLPGNPKPERVMDRLHAFSYFLEALLSCAGKDDPNAERAALALADGIALVAHYLREIAPVFARSDVYAQLLRVRLLASGFLPLDRHAAAEEAKELATFQMASEDPRIDGGFTFGKLHGDAVPHVNPVSTAFALQALHLWTTRTQPPLSALI
jgi:hypothetical protein